MDGHEGIFVSGFLLYGVAKLREEAASEFERVHWREAVQFVDEEQTFSGKINRDVDFSSERPDGAFGATRKIRARVETNADEIHSNRNEPAISQQRSR